MPPHNTSPIPPDNQDFFINQIANGLAATTELIQSLSTESRDNAISLATLRVELSNVTEDVRNLSKIIKDGNGSDPILSRIAVLEKTTATFEDSLKSIKSDLSKSEKLLSKVNLSLMTQIEEKKLVTENVKSKRQTWVAIITSIIALITAIVVAVIA